MESIKKKIVQLFESAPVSVDIDETRQMVIDDFMEFCQKKLGLQSMPYMELLPYKTVNMTTASYNPSLNELQILAGNRALVDILRSIAHELVHRQQDEQGRLNPGDGPGYDGRQDIGAPYENEANAVGGALIKEFSRFYDGLPQDQIYEL